MTHHFRTSPAPESRAEVVGGGFWAYVWDLETTVHPGWRNEQSSRFGKQSFDAAKDENAVIFLRNRQVDFTQLRDAIEAAVAGVPAAAGAAQPDAVDQLRRRAELRDTGVLSGEEFDTAHARLLGGHAL